MPLELPGSSSIAHPHWGDVQSGRRPGREGRKRLSVQSDKVEKALYKLGGQVRRAILLNATLMKPH